MADLDAEKLRAAHRAADEIRDGMLVGLGTGSTVNHAVRVIGERVAQGLRITATATSRATETLARSLQIPLVDFSTLAQIDLAIDGADEVDDALRAIKGGGGALFREKIVATAARRVIIIVDSSKPVAQLGKFKLPVEVHPFASKFVEYELAKFGVPLLLRRDLQGAPFLTDQQQYVIDLAFERIADPAALAHALDAIPGIVEHGLFLNEIDVLIIGGADGARVVERPPLERNRA